MISGVTSGDIHIGAHEPELIRNELRKGIMRFITDRQPSMIVIAGDLFDRKINFQEVDGDVVNEFINFLKDYTVNNTNVYVRILRGTLSHDINQLRSFKNMESTKFRIIENIELEELDFGTENHLFLYVPEEYPKDSKAYLDEIYSTIESEKVSMAFMHGTFDFTAFSDQKIDSEKPIKAAPIFDSNIMTKFIKCIHAGHIHKPLDWKNCIWYTNSYSRSSFGEEDEKGFLSFVIDSETITTERVINKLAPVYKTVVLSELLVNVEITVENIVKVIKNLKKNFANLRNLRVINDIRDQLDSEIIKRTFKLDESVKIELPKKRSGLTSDILEEDDDTTFDFILKRELPHDQTIQKFAKIKFDFDLTLEEINEAIKEEVEEEGK